MIKRISVDEASMVIQGLFIRKNITKGNIIPINENGEQAVLVFGMGGSGELIFKVDAERNIFYRNNEDWQIINN